ncbi:MAG: response regulator transcription factor [Lewinellaceae bacterium]|jgi:DNA-binding NarL/FixJ family response regulator|nr:response regulator transcription factor [Lewinellaceae bacterium]
MIKILIADDHRLVIDGLLLMLREVEDMDCVGEAANGREALALLDSTLADVLLLDINMPEMDGLECCRIVKERHPQVKVLVLSMMRELSLVKAMLKHGASGFLLKNAGKEEVLESIRKVSEGKQAFSEDVLESLMNSFSNKPAKSSISPFPTISKREKQILQLIVDEKTTSEIAEDLFISFGTVETHRRNLLLKLNARNTAGLVKSALEYDLL